MFEEKSDRSLVVPVASQTKLRNVLSTEVGLQLAEHRCQRKRNKRCCYLSTHFDFSMSIY